MATLVHDVGNIEDEATHILMKLSQNEKEILENYYMIKIKNIRTKSKFTALEDSKLKDLVNQYGTLDWKKISNYMTGRTARQCRERWINYLSPNTNSSPFTSDEDELLRKLYSEIGPKWAQMSKSFHNRTDINLKNRWITLLRKDADQKNENDNHIKRNNYKLEMQPNEQIDDFSSFIGAD